ncbi:MAG: hypothetical protein JOY77_11540 [Alphaproteobacteria bacterium]|nr:hypothetical protein [Alphaproteobacteria bacterium]
MSHPALQLMLLGCLVASTSSAQSDPLLGDWKLNPSKSTYIDQFKVERLGGDLYGFDFGGGEERIVADGTEQPGVSGTRLAVTVESADRLQVVRTKDGRKLLSAAWKLSPDGNSLSDDYTDFGADGPPSTVHYLYKRVAPGEGFAGTWNAPVPIDSAPVLQIKPFAHKGLSFIQPARQITRNLEFDGKDYPVLGAGAPAGATASARRVGADTVEITAKVSGTVTRTEQLKLSPDLQTLTSTIHPIGQRDPNVFVYERQP